MMRWLIGLALLLDAAAAAAAQAIVEALQSPAWVERAGQREPLAAGQALRENDRVVSGAQGRILLRMPEGSLVKLGEQAELHLGRLAVEREPSGQLVRAALHVVRGAFRFTTQAVARYRGRRHIDVRIATVTAGIRGTDLWGKAANDRDIVCLIEGRITVQRQGESAFAMDQPLSFYIAPRNAPALPVAPVPQEQLARWAAETEIQPGLGAIRRTGRWRLELLRAPTQAEALALYDRLRQAGYPPRIVPLREGSGYAYSVRIHGLPSEAEALALAARLKDVAGVSSPRALRG